MDTKRYELNKQLAQMLKGGVIMDVTTPEQARIAEEAGACAVMALERIPADIRAAGGVATPADAALMMQLGAEGVFVGSGIFKSGDPKKRAAAIVKAVTNYQDSKMLAELSEEMTDVDFFGLDVDQNPVPSVTYGIHSVPTLILFKDGLEVDRLIGFTPKNELVRWIEENK